MGRSDYRQFLRLLAALLGVHAGASHAQIRLPPITVPTQPVTGIARQATDLASNTVSTALSDVRSLRIQALLKANPSVLDRDRDGNLIVRGELLASGPVGHGAGVALPAGVTVLRTRSLEGLDLELTVLAVAPHRSLARVLKALRAADPQGIYDYNHVYLSVGDPVDTGPRAAGPGSAAAPAGAPRAPSIGLIDSGVDTAHAALAHAVVVSWGCEHPVPAAHGTAVASLIAGDDPPFHGAAPRAHLFAADVYCDRATGGAVDAVAGAFAWLIERAVPVVNVSLVGPRNAALEAVIRHVQSLGQLVVAAVGNDGPAAPPLYPAAYPGVIGVTAVDAKRRVLLEANRGPQVRFAAPGADLLAAAAGGGYQPVRGTSYAAPIVAGLLGARCADPEPGCGARAAEELAREAIPLGGGVPNPVYGAGLVGERVRTAPAQ